MRTDFPFYWLHWRLSNQHYKEFDLQKDEAAQKKVDEIEVNRNHYYTVVRDFNVRMFFP